MSTSHDERDHDRQPHDMKPVGPNKWSFPDPSEWGDDDVVCVGADLEPSTVIHAYRHGMFPMYVDARHRNLGWWSPLVRGVLVPGSMRVTRSLRQNARRYKATMDTAFRDVVMACATTRKRGNWITDDIVDAYCTLHEMGWAHSVETWNAEGKLVGGLYGVHFDSTFAGESMFHTETDASKVALMKLVEWAEHNGVTLIDAQWNTEHLTRLGFVDMSREHYLARLATPTD